MLGCRESVAEAIELTVYVSGAGARNAVREISSICHSPQQDEKGQEPKNSSHRVATTPSREESGGPARIGVQSGIQKLFGCGHYEDQRERNENRKEQTRNEKPEVPLAPETDKPCHCADHSRADLHDRTASITGTELPDGEGYTTRHPGGMFNRGDVKGGACE